MKRLLAIAGALALAAMLAGCAGVSPQVASIVPKVAQAKAGVIDFTKSDLAEASRLAHDSNDVIAYTCWDYLITVVPEPDTGASNGRIDGVATAFQRTRDVVKRLNAGVSDELRLHCGPLYLDAKDDVSGIAGRIASLAAKLGVTGFSPF